MNQQNINRALPSLTAEAYFKHKEVIEAWLQGACIEYLDQDNEWYYVPNPAFSKHVQFRIKADNIKKYIVVGSMEVDNEMVHHTCGVWSTPVGTDSVDFYPEMQDFKLRTLIELEINPSNGKVVAVKVVE